MILIPLETFRTDFLNLKKEMKIYENFNMYTGGYDIYKEQQLYDSYHRTYSIIQGILINEEIREVLKKHIKPKYLPNDWF